MEVGLNSFSIFLVDRRSLFQRSKSPKFSVTRVAPTRDANASAHVTIVCVLPLKNEAAEFWGLAKFQASCF